MNAIWPIAETTETVTLSRVDFETLIEALEELDDIAFLERQREEEARIGPEAVRLKSVTGEEMLRLIEGEPPLSLWRRKRGMSASDLAAASGVAEATIHAVEASTEMLDRDAAERLAPVLRIDWDMLLRVQAK